MRPRVRSWTPDLITIVRTTYSEWRDDRTIRLGAGLAYYGLISLTSVIAVVIGLLRIVGRSGTFEQDVENRIAEIGGVEAVDAVAEMFDRLDGSAGTTIGLIGLGSLLITGSLFFLALEDAIHQIWDVPVRIGWRSSIVRRLISLVVLLGTAATLIASLAVQAVSTVLDRLVPGSTPGLELVSTALANVASWSVLAGALTLLFKYLPTVDVAWRPMLVAGVVTALLLVIGTALIGWYLRTVGASSLSGVASTPIAILLWIYFEAQILLAGVQLSKVLEHRRR